MCYVAQGASFDKVQYYYGIVIATIVIAIIAFKRQNSLPAVLSAPSLEREILDCLMHNSITQDSAML